MSDKSYARKEIMSALNLLLGDNAPAYPELLEAFKQVGEATREYLLGEIELETAAGGCCATCGVGGSAMTELQGIDLHRRFADESSRLVRNTATGYNLTHVGAIQMIAGHLIALTALIGTELPDDPNEPADAFGPCDECGTTRGRFYEWGAKGKESLCQACLDEYNRLQRAIVHDVGEQKGEGYNTKKGR